MRITIISICFLLFGSPVFCQWHDNNIILGYDFEHDASLSETFMLSFDSSSLAIKQYPVKLDFSATNLTVSDGNGNLMFYSNGIQIHDKDDNLMPGGDSLNAGEVAYVNWQYGYTLMQGIMALPTPGNPVEYNLIHRKKEFNDSTGINVPDLLYTVDLCLYEIQRLTHNILGKLNFIFS
jgi:hypothetical protein